MEERLESSSTVLFVYIDMIMGLKNMSYKDLAEGSGIGRQTIANMKWGSQRITLERLQEIFYTLGVNYKDYLLYIEFIQESGLYSAIALP